MVKLSCTEIDLIFAALSDPVPAGPYSHNTGCSWLVIEPTFWLTRKASIYCFQLPLWENFSKGRRKSLGLRDSITESAVQAADQNQRWRCNSTNYSVKQIKMSLLRRLLALPSPLAFQRTISAYRGSKCLILFNISSQWSQQALCPVEAGLLVELFRWSNSLLHEVSFFILPLANSASSSVIRIPRRFLQLYCKKLSAVVDLTGEAEYFSSWAGSGVSNRWKSMIGKAIQQSIRLANWYRLILVNHHWRLTDCYRLLISSTGHPRISTTTKCWQHTVIVYYW